MYGKHCPIFQGHTQGQVKLKILEPTRLKPGGEKKGHNYYLEQRVAIL